MGRKIVNHIQPVIAAADVFTALGDGLSVNWERMLKGECGLRTLQRISSDKPEIRVGGEITRESFGGAAFNPETLAFDLAVKVGRRVLDKAGGLVSDIEPSRLGLILSTTKGEMAAFENLFIHNKFDFNFNAYHLAQNLARELAVPGPVWAVSNACASGLVAIIQAAWLIKWGQADVMLVIGVDTLTEFVLEGFNCLRALSPNPCRPFDESRDGITLGDGVGVLLLVRPDLVSGPPKAVLSGWGISNDANHITGPSRTGLGLKLALNQALNQAKLEKSDIACLNAHGTATMFNDETESQAYFDWFGPDGPCISAFKGYIGHTLGAAGLIETALCLMTFEDNLVPGTLGFSCLGVTKPLRIVAEKTRLKQVDHIVTAKAGFGGVNAALVLTRGGI